MGIKVTIIGGGSSMFVPDLFRRFLQAPCMVGGTVSLMDVDEQRLSVMGELGKRADRGREVRPQNGENARPSRVAHWR